jgi:putative hydrolase of the HAD superfamily
MPDIVRCRPEVMDGLLRLRAASGWKVASSPTGRQTNHLGKLQQTGLAEAVDAYALSGIEGVRKPDRGLLVISQEIGRPKCRSC